MSAGSVSVTAAGVVTKSGIAGTLFDLLKTAPTLCDPSAPLLVEGVPGDAPALKAAAVTANTFAPVLDRGVTGTITMWGGSESVPPFSLLCDKSAVSRTTYANLFAAIGTIWGVGDGSTTFNLPDFRGRSPLGTGTGDAADATAHAQASAGGTETHALTSAEMPAHTHALAAGNFVTSGAGAVGAAGGDLGSAAATATTGGGTSHNNMHPFTGVRFIIWT